MNFNVYVVDLDMAIDQEKPETYITPDQWFHETWYINNSRKVENKFYSEPGELYTYIFTFPSNANIIWLIH